MADYYPVLKRAVDTHPDQSAEARRGVYDRLRGALQQQLAGYNPPLSPEETTAQLDALEASIARLEDELAPPPAPAPEETPRGRRRKRARAAVARPQQAAPVATPIPAASTNAGSSDAPAAETPATAPLTAEAGEPPRPVPAARARGPKGRRDGWAGAGAAAPQQRSSRLPAVAALAVFMMVVGGLAAFVWNNRERLTPMFSGSPAVAATASTIPRPAVVLSEVLPPKGDEQLEREESLSAARAAGTVSTNLAADGNPIPVRRPGSEEEDEAEAGTDADDAASTATAGTAVEPPAETAAAEVEATPPPAVPSEPMPIPRPTPQ